MKAFYQRFNLLITKKTPLFFLLFLIFLLSVQLVVNSFRHEPLLTNFESSLGLFWILLTAYLATLVTSKKTTLFLLSFVLNFIYILIVNILNKSIMDYSSFLIIGIQTLFQAFFSFGLAFDLFNRKKAN